MACHGGDVTGELIRAGIERRIHHVMLIVLALPGLLFSHGSNEAAAAMLACGVAGIATATPSRRIPRMIARARSARRRDRLLPAA